MVDYHRYMASRAWRLKRKEIIDRAGNICERCGLAPVENVHHLTYERLGNESLEDLEGVCRPCHAYESAEAEFNPADAPLETVLKRCAELKIDLSIRDPNLVFSWPEPFPEGLLKQLQRHETGLVECLNGLNLIDLAIDSLTNRPIVGDATEFDLKPDVWRSIVRKLGGAKGRKFNLGALLRDVDPESISFTNDVLVLPFRHQRVLNYFQQEMESQSSFGKVYSYIAEGTGQQAPPIRVVCSE